MLTLKDLGEERAIYLNNKCNFPWILTNIRWIDDKPIAGAPDHVIITHNGLKIGLISLGEYEWCEALGQIDVEDIKYTPFVESGKEWVSRLSKLATLS